MPFAIGVEGGLNPYAYGSSGTLFAAQFPGSHIAKPQRNTLAAGAHKQAVIYARVSSKEQAHAPSRTCAGGRPLVPSAIRRRTTATLGFCTIELLMEGWSPQHLANPLTSWRKTSSRSRKDGAAEARKSAILIIGSPSWTHIELFAWHRRPRFESCLRRFSSRVPGRSEVGCKTNVRYCRISRLSATSRHLSC